jgi:hypothetical protein
LIALYGTKIKYYRYNYRTERHDYLYAEDPAANYSPPVEMIAIVQLNQDALTLGKFGIQTNSELQCYIPFETFSRAIGNAKAYPMAQDIIELTEVGIDRPGGGGYPYFYTGTSACTSGDNDSVDAIACDSGNRSLSNDFISSDCNPVSSWIRGPSLYEITEYRDENIAAGLNPMLSHNVWSIKGTRFDNSYQPDAPQEIGSDMVNDSPTYGKLPGGSDTPESNKKYTQNADQEAGTYWEFGQNGLDSVYGGYKQKARVPVITYDPTKDPYSPKYLYDAVENLVMNDSATNTDYKLVIKGGLVTASVYIPTEPRSSTCDNNTPREYVTFKDLGSNTDYKLQIYYGVINIDPVQQEDEYLETLGSPMGGIPNDQVMSFHVPITFATPK